MVDRGRLGACVGPVTREKTDILRVTIRIPCPHMTDSGRSGDRYPAFALNRAEEDRDNRSIARDENMSERVAVQELGNGRHTGHCNINATELPPLILACPPAQADIRRLFIFCNA